MIIAFMGNDGSGKTTLSKNFSRYLKEVGIENEYREEFKYFILSYLFKLFEKKIKKIRIDFLKRKAKPKIRWYFKLWPFLVLIDQFLFWLYLRIFKRNKIVILDRYVYDFLMSWEWLGYSNWFVRWLYFRFPRPDIGFICDASPQTCYNRKRKTHNYDLKFYEIQRSRYLNLANKLGIKVISTEKPIKQTLEEVLREFRKFFINKLSDEDKILTLASYPYFSPKLISDLKVNINWNILDWNYIIDMAAKNNVELLLCKNLLRYYRKKLSSETIKKLNRVMKICEKEKEKIFKTLRVISKRFENENIKFIVFKTFPPFEYVPTDIDILVEKDNFEKAKETLKRIFHEQILQKGHKAITFKKNGLTTVDLHYEISWSGSKSFEKVVGKIYKKVGGDKILLPSVQDELSIVIAHSIFQHHYTTLGEFYFIISLLRMLNRSELKNLLENENVKFLITYSVLKEFLIYNNKYIAISLKNNYPIDLFTINHVVFLHPARLVPKNTFRQFLDFLLSVYRNIRFRVSGKLAYNENWLRGIKI
jgi:thymidylate kinase